MTGHAPHGDSKPAVAAAREAIEDFLSRRYGIVSAPMPDEEVAKILAAALPHLDPREVAQATAGGPVPGAGPGSYWCCVCGLTAVDANQGFDTCPECVGNV